VLELGDEEGGFFGEGSEGEWQLVSEQAHAQPMASDRVFDAAQFLAGYFFGEQQMFAVGHTDTLVDGNLLE
jgi:hypothetical protein